MILYLVLAGVVYHYAAWWCSLTEAERTAEHVRCKWVNAINNMRGHKALREVPPR